MKHDNAHHQPVAAADFNPQTRLRPQLGCMVLLCGDSEVVVDEASDRCAEFIADIAEVCRKHRVMMRLDEEENESPVFVEHPPSGGSGFGFILEAEDLEDAIRNAVWDVIHPSA